jgi:hypothetical protein
MKKYIILLAIIVVAQASFADIDSKSKNDDNTQELIMPSEYAKPISDEEIAEIHRKTSDDSDKSLQNKK